jgi:integrase
VVENPPQVTFGQAGAAFLQFKRKIKSQRTIDKHAWLLGVLRKLWPMPLTDITAPDILKVLRGLEGRSQNETARRAGQFAGRVFRYSIGEGWCRYNPAGDLRGNLEGVQTVSLAAITDPVKFGKLVENVDALWMYGSHPSVYNGLRLIARTALRPSELRLARWSEIDRDKAEWRVPASRMKMRREHLVPLSTQALKILEEQWDVSGEGDLVFPGMRAGRPLSDAAMNICLKQTLMVSGDVHTVHGFRSSFSTLMNELGEFDPAVIELQLSHAKKDKIAGIYDRSQRVPDRIKLMQRWADYIDELKEKAK